MPEIEFTLDPTTGQLELHVRGMAGPACEDVAKLAAELLWLAEKMSVYGFVDEAVERWASASNLAWLALWSEPRLQCSMVQISGNYCYCLFLFKFAV